MSAPDFSAGLGRIEMRHLASLAAIAEEGSFSAAALRLGYTQSGVSQQIATLERAVGHKLFERPGGSRRVTLTPVGAVLLAHTKPLLERMAAVQADIARLAEDATLVIRIGTFSSVANTFLPSLVQSFMRAWPHVTVELVERPDDDELVKLLEEGALDASFVMPPMDDGPFLVEELITSDYVAIIPREFGVPPSDDPIDLEDLADFPLIAYRHSREQNRSENFLRGRGIEPHIIFRSDDNGLVQKVVGVGLGAAIVPPLAVAAGDKDIIVRRIVDCPHPWSVGIARHKDRFLPPALDDFIYIAHKVAKEYQRVTAELALEQ